MGGETTEMSATTTHVLIEAAHWDPVAIFRTERRHKLPPRRPSASSAASTRPSRSAAADRVVELLTTYGGGTVEPGVTVRRRGRRRRAAITIDPRPARPGHRHGHRRARRRSPTCAPSAASVDGAAIALSVTPPPWRRDLTDPFDLVEEVARIVGYANVPSVLPPRGPRPRADPRASGCAGGSVAPWPAPGSSRWSASRSSATRDLDALGLPPTTTCAGTCCGWPTRCRREEPAMTTTLLPGLLKAVARNAGRGNTDVALFETGHRHAAARPRARRRSSASTGGPPRASSTSSTRRSRTSRCTSGRRLAATASAPAGGARAAQATWADAVDGVRRTRRGPRRRRSTVRRRRARALAPRPLRRDPASATPSLGHAGELHPRVVRGVRRPGPHRRRRDRPRPACSSTPSTSSARPEFSDFPVAKEDVALVVDDAVTAARRRGGPARGRGGAPRVGPALRRLHRRPGRRGQEVAGLRPALPGPRPHADRGTRPAPPATPRSPWPPSGAAPSSD